jgi:hypothetical protein
MMLGGWLGGAESGERLARTASGVVVMADRGDPVLRIVELTCDHLLDVGVEWSVRTEIELPEHRHEGAIFSGQLSELRPGGVEQTHGVVGEI